ncbi:carbon-nitrogen hydrolase family protein [Pseudomonas sp. PB120]|uniref:carbon-nitrogen hydrolase family protein n=1 Tax=Pseudomonas sp. PB120 TaxID=2494700 RepID=UPI0012FE0E46|nr:carbon-nitrogen hydrolase family protein [Pseudomonas sp. PB120]MVV49740.1 carbon-nitrogen hydrolase family protein [Pseudomonas sp. PB120]
MKLELVQMAGRDGDVAYNLQRTLDAIADCGPGTDIVMFPESHITGFLNHDNIARLAEPLQGPSVQAISRAARERDVAVVIGLIESDGGQFYNTLLLITPEGVALSYRKTHLWVSEPGLVLPGDRYATVQWRGVRIGLLICYDIEFPESARALAALGAELILISDGNMEPYGHLHHTAVAARAQENQVFAAMVNRVGEGDGETYAGGSTVVDPFGRRLFEAGSQECRHVVELDMTRIAPARALYDYRVDKRFTLPGALIEHPDGRRELLIP